MMNIHFLIPGDLETSTGGYVYDRHIITGLEASGHDITVHALSPAFPFPGTGEIDKCRSILESVPPAALILVDSLAFAPLAELIREKRSRNPVVGLVHVPLSHSPDLAPSQRKLFEESEKEALRTADRLVVTSLFTARMIGEMGIGEEKVRVVLPGTNRAERKKAYSSVPRHLLCVGSYLPNKGYSTLIAALAGMKDKPWNLDIYGETRLNPGYITELENRIEDLGLAGRIILHPAVPYKILDEVYRQADLFVHPSLFETYGMAPAEALAHGLPVVASHAGALPETLPPGPVRFFRPGDVEHLRETLSSLFENSREYGRLCTEATLAGAKTQTWEESQRLFIRALEEIDART